MLHASDFGFSIAGQLPAGDLSDHPFSPESVARESGAPSSSERKWLAFAAECERLLGHGLDGNDPDAFDPTRTGGDGYSIDEAHEAFRAGKSPHTYVATVTSRDRYQAA